jgi:hypothetical protein
MRIHDDALATMESRVSWEHEGIRHTDRQRAQRVDSWRDLLPEFEPRGLVLEYFLKSGKYRGLETYSMRGLPRPENDNYYDQMHYADPVYAVWGRKAPSAG